MLLERTSTLSLQNTLLNSSRRVQASLQRAQAELSTGRHADVGLALGAQVGRNLLWRSELAEIESATKRQELMSGRAQTTQASVEAIKETAAGLLESAMGARSARNGNELSRSAGENALQGMMEILSTRYAGEHIFSGRTPDVAPLQGYEGKPAQSAFDAAFVAEFGFAKNSPLAAGITPSQIQTFLDGRFADLFNDPAWTADWSQSDSGNMLARIGGSATVDISANANNEAFRSVLKGAVALFELGGTAIGQGTLQVVADSAVQQLSQGQEKLGEMQSRIGHGQQSVQQSIERMAQKKNLVEIAITRTEGVSDVEAASRLNALMTQLESSYAVTARISQLSLLNYL